MFKYKKLLIIKCLVIIFLPLFFLRAQPPLLFNEDSKDLTLLANAFAASKNLNEQERASLMLEVLSFGRLVALEDPSRKASFSSYSVDGIFENLIDLIQFYSLNFAEPSIFESRKAGFYIGNFGFPTNEIDVLLFADIASYHRDQVKFMTSDILFDYSLAFIENFKKNFVIYVNEINLSGQPLNDQTLSDINEFKGLSNYLSILPLDPLSERGHTGFKFPSEVYSFSEEGIKISGDFEMTGGFYYGFRFNFDTKFGRNILSNPNKLSLFIRMLNKTIKEIDLPYEEIKLQNSIKASKAIEACSHQVI